MTLRLAGGRNGGGRSERSLSFRTGLSDVISRILIELL